MKNILLLSFFCIILIVLVHTSVFGQTIEQRLIIVQNDAVLNGDFDVAIQLKGTGLTAANTLGSATIDVYFNNSQLQYDGATNAGLITAGTGYSNSTPINNTTYIRYGPLGLGVPDDGPGYDIGSVYQTVVTLNFTILIPNTEADLTISSGTNQVGLFNSHANSNGTGTIVNQTLSSPVNIVDEPLPVELTSFYSEVDQKSISLKWHTVSEVQNYGFDIERKAVAGDWQKIGFVEGRGNSNSPAEYQFNDANPIGGSKFLYRLKQIDTDGQFTYSVEVEAEIIPDQFEMFQNYPNPFNPNTIIRFSVPKATELKINVYSVLGEKVLTAAEGIFEPGFYETEINGLNLSSGTYIYRIESSDFVQTKKMMLLK